MKAVDFEMTQNKKVCLLGAAFETNNMGVGALAAGTIKSILNAYPGAEIILLDYGRQGVNYDFPVDGSTIPVKLVNMRFSKKLYLKNNIALLLFLAALLKIIPSERIKTRILSNSPCLNQVNESDLIISIAGGDSFSDIYGITNFLYVTLPQILILLLGKDLILMPQTLGPYSSRIARAMAIYILNHATVVYSRDHASLKEIKALPGVKSDTGRLKFCYDVGFILDPVKPGNVQIVGLKARTPDSSCLVGLNVSGLLYMGGYTRKNMFGFKQDYGELVYKVIDYLIKEKNAVVMLVPHVFGSKEHAESDSSACQKIYEELKDKFGDSLALVQGTYNQNEIKYIIGLSAFFIGSRMHACIAAVSQNIPAVSIAYSKKFRGVMDTIDMGDYVADPREMNEKEILDLIGRAYDERIVIKDKLEQRMPEVKERVSNLIKEVSEVLDMREKTKVNRI